MKITPTTPFEYSGRTVQGTVKRTQIKQTVTTVIETIETKIEFKIPEGYTFDEFGDYHKSSNAYKPQIKSIKQSKKRMARMNIKIENAIQINAYNAVMYANAMIEKITQTKKNSNKRQNKRK
jgi:hypothetical protein